MTTASLVAERLSAVRDRITRAGGTIERVRIVAVTKGFGSAVVRAALDAGCVELGENYAQELWEKADDLAADPPSHLPAWHFIGRLQTNKVKAVAPLVALWQSVDRDALVDEIARRAPGAPVLVQVNIGDEPQKGGCPADATEALVTRAADSGLDVRGLMGVAPVGDAAAPAFALLRRLVDQLGLVECSMGMTDDLEAAVGAGSTMVRVGSALFGPRPLPGRLGQ